MKRSLSMFIKKAKNILYLFKQYFISLFYYPQLQKHDETYNRYWGERKLTQSSFNSFQKQRADLALPYLEPDSILMDVGCGAGLVLTYINQAKPMKRLIGADISNDALEIAKNNNIETLKIDLNNAEGLKLLPEVDYVFLFEVLEHLANSEAVLSCLLAKAQKGLFFSVPNTGFFTHRFRLFFGRFPLQWRVHPSEHLRFWTVKDMIWWLKKLDIKNYKLVIYEGMPLLNKLWPFLFGQGIWVYIKNSAKEDV